MHLGDSALMRSTHHFQSSECLLLIFDSFLQLLFELIPFPFRLLKSLWQIYQLVLDVELGNVLYLKIERIPLKQWHTKTTNTTNKSKSGRLRLTDERVIPTSLLEPTVQSGSIVFFQQLGGATKATYTLWNRSRRWHFLVKSRNWGHSIRKYSNNRQSNWRRNYINS